MVIAKIIGKAAGDGVWLAIKHDSTVAPGKTTCLIGPLKMH